MHAQELITITSPTATTVFEPGATFSIDVELGGEAAELLASDPTTKRLTSTFALSGAELTIEAVAPPGSDTDAAAVRDGIVIAFPRAAYDSAAGGSGLGGVTTADGLRLEINDTSNSPANIFFTDGRSSPSRKASTRYSPSGGGAGFIPSRLSPFGSIHIVQFSIEGVGSQTVLLQQLIQLIRAHEITIASDYSGGAFNLHLTLAETPDAFFGRIGDQETVTAEILIRGGAAGAPIVPGDRVVNAVAGDTLATLTWAVAQDRRTLEATDVQYEATVTERGVSSTFTMSSSDYTLNDTGTMAGFTLDRATAVLLPDKPYELTMRACDLSDNCSDQEYSGTFRTTSLGPVTNGIHDELEGEVSAAGGIAAYCGGGGDHADGDGDGVPNSVEVRLGTDCRSGVGDAANDFVGAGRPMITVSATGAETVGGEDYLIRPGTGAMTEVAAGVTCPGCTTLNAYEDEDADGSTAEGACITAPGLAGSDMNSCRAVEINDGRMLLGSFSREILWVGEDAAGNWVTQVQRFYIQPPVGFDASRARADGGTVDLPLSVAVSDDVASGSFEAEVELTGVAAPATATVRSVVSGVPVTLTEGMTKEVVLSLTGGGAIPGDATPDFSEPYVLGNSTVTVSLLMPPTMTEPAFEFTPPPLFVDDDDSGLPAFSITSTPEAEMYEVTATILQRASSVLTVEPSAVPAGQNVTVSFGGNVQAGDIIEVKATGTTAGQTVGIGTFFVSVVADPAAVGNGIPVQIAGLQTHELPTEGGLRLEVSGGTAVLGGYALAASNERGVYSADIPDTLTMSMATGNIGTPPNGYPGTGVFDFIVTGVAPGGVVSVLISLRGSVTQTGLRLFKYDNDGGWGQFTSGPADAYYGAPAPCPAISAPRGTGAGEWRAADDSGFQVGDGCVLLEITDGGMNDADGTRNGVVYDPNALGSGSSSVSGGATDPIWLLLATLALALSYTSRRRQRTNR